MMDRRSTKAPRGNVNDAGRRPTSLLFPHHGWFWLRQRPWPIFSCFRLASEELTQPNPPNELLNFVSKLNAFLSIVVVVTMVETVFASIALVRRRS
ncbi:hypothetical protein COCNU_10G004750 [Cocos nucifera]|uniref:Uncharacterized protein n=1 Tax=Cocos nucifera TaxID=13894 RepID=A0A8K0IL81_COCNU|nr:hypothetical protein COCNU_10G004750 [Cocos nucifera]